MVVTRKLATRCVDGLWDHDKFARGGGESEERREPNRQVVDRESGNPNRLDGGG